MKRLLSVFALAAIIVGGFAVALAQRTTATFAGIVQDSTGAVLPGVEASLTNEVLRHPNQLERKRLW